MKKNIIFLMVLLILSTYNAESKETGKVLGTVISKGTQQPIVGITVAVLGTKKGTFTNGDGKYEINDLPPGMYSIRFSGIGYETYVQADVTIVGGLSKSLDVDLAEQIINVDEITVRASYFSKNVETVTSTQILSADDIRKSPGTNEDVVRAAALLPGVGVTAAGRNDLVVRGGAPFENLFIVDGIEVPNINHFGSQGSTGGPLSIINLDFVKNVTFSAGGFGAQYGDKVSSLLNIELRNGNSDRYGGKVVLSASGFGLNLEGPVSENSSFLFSARRSYLDLIFNAAGFSFIPEYWDFQGKLNYQIDKENYLTFLAIGALNDVKLNNETLDDKYSNSRIAVPRQNQYFSGISWKHLFSSGFARVTLGRTYTDFNTTQRDSLLNEILSNESTEGETSLKTELIWMFDKELEINVGNQIKYASLLDYDLYVDGPFRKDQYGVPHTLDVDTSITAIRNSTYGSVTFSFGHHKFTLGSRLDYFDYIEDPLYFSPRASMIYQINDVSAINLGFGRYYQSPSFIWLMGAPEQKLEAIRADQVVIGYDHTPLEEVKVQFELFYKWYGNYPARAYRPQAVLAPTGFDDISSDIPFGLEPLISGGKGWSRGAELFIQKKISDIPLYGLISISVLESMFEGLDGEERPGSFDTRFIFNISAGYRLSEDWEISGKFRLATGLPTTPFLPNGQIDFSQYNEGDRLPLFHSLDLRADKRWMFDGFFLVTYIDIQNVYNQKNVSRVSWNYREMKEEFNRSLGILPTIGVNLEF